MTLEAVEELGDEEFAMWLARARWLEGRWIERVEQGLLRALATAFGRRSR